MKPRRLVLGLAITISLAVVTQAVVVGRFGNAFSPASGPPALAGDDSSPGSSLKPPLPKKRRFAEVDTVLVAVVGPVVPAPPAGIARKAGAESPPAVNAGFSPRPRSPPSAHSPI